MNVVPAQEAGVGSLAVASPPQRENRRARRTPDDPRGVRAARRRRGVRRRRRPGGGDVRLRRPGLRGRAVCEPADLVTGPGNIYVAAAKRLLKGVIGIDSEAGPTEIAILADDTADPVHVAADLVSQAEHDPMAAAVLVTPASRSRRRSRPSSPAGSPAPSTRSGSRPRWRAAVGGRPRRRPRAGLAVVDAYAAEHLEIQTRDAAPSATRVTNAGAVFVGPWSPGQPRRLLRRVQPRAAHRRVRLLLQRLSACTRSCGACR